MSAKDHKASDRIDEMRKWYVGHQGGIFHQKTREKMVTKEGISEKSPAKNTFWYRQRESVKTALIDINLFLEEAGESNVEQVISEDSIAPLLHTILSREPLEGQDMRKAGIARLMIILGFNYLRWTHVNKLTVSHKNTIHEAVDLADFLAESLKPIGKRDYPSYLTTGI